MTSGTEQATLNTEENGSDSDHLSKEPIAMPALDWDGPTDSNNPRNFSTPKKVFITACLASLVCISTFGSSVMSPASGQLIHEFGISKELSILATALYVLGFAVGPLLFGPASEVLGRKYPLSVGVFLFAIFSIPIAVAKNVATIFVCRFLCGTFAAAPLAIAGGGLADLWEPLSRGIAVAGFASATFLGPVLGPLVGGFVTKSHLGWRWTQWLSIIFSLVFLAIYFVFCPETYSPIVLARLAKKRGQMPPGGKVDFKQLAKVYMLRPFIMLVQEPILALLTLYMGFIYGFLYLCFEAFPIAFEEHRGWDIGIGSLPFLSITVGVLIGVVIIIVHTMTRMRRKLETVGDAPEERLVPMMIGSILMPAGIFWFAWTSNTSLPWAPQVVSGVFIGCGILLIFLQGMNYIIDVYKVMANSAISINAMFRGLLGAGFPLFASYMFDNLGVPWAMSLLGFLCVALVPVPFLFFIYGERIRKWSKFTAH
ncbi:MFS-type transporter TraF [Penicillium crustosum]|uniref:MFS-type transporter traF n=1 Tax=Penicillium crustosum TaxID=36656 RepID=TRAF_PENCR|nr:RecName: Full=MFS-type transporter traF; AltName: Full=Terrestric acid biosynthesis cluster protein F [Penicillium crustosum]QBK15054.1 major facilitator TraF [Penicillium crustosum]